MQITDNFDVILRNAKKENSKAKKVALFRILSKLAVIFIF